MFLNYIERDTPVYIVVSHHHKDHFNPAVFEWAKYFPNIKYILSRDTYLHSRHYVEPDSMYSGSKRVDFQKVFRIRPGETFEDNHLKICAYRSTDTGNAYSIEFKINGLTAFHAGDLNAWTWRDESTDDEIEESVNDYKGVIEEIARDHNAFDLVMFPVDPRIGSYYYEGAEIFLKKFRTGLFIPMHYCLFQGEDEKKKFEALASDFEKYATDKCSDYRFMLPYDSFSF